jgi:hypothetical protein
MKTTYSTRQLSTESPHRHDCHREDSLALPPRLRELFETRFAALRDACPHLLHLAITEAAALAERTGFPQLFLPELALEKAEAVAAWHHRQRRTLQNGAGFRVRRTQLN